VVAVVAILEKVILFEMVMAKNTRKHILDSRGFFGQKIKY